jgi:hypothetical protein
VDFYASCLTLVTSVAFRGVTLKIFAQLKVEKFDYCVALLVVRVVKGKGSPLTR